MEIRQSSYRLFVWRNLNQCPKIKIRLPEKLRHTPFAWISAIFPEWAEASFVLDFFVLFYQEKSTIKIPGNKLVEFVYDLGQSRKKCGREDSHVANGQLTLLILQTLLSALDRKSGGRGAAGAWIASDFIDSLFLSHQGERKKRNGNKLEDFTYGPGQSRKTMKTFEKEGDDWILKKTKYYILGNTEIEIDETTGETRTLTYVSGDAVWEQTPSGNNLYYLQKDYLGSVRSISDETGALVEEHSYDACGFRRFCRELFQNQVTWW